MSLSGLITPSLDEMIDVAKELQRDGKVILAQLNKTTRQKEVDLR